MKRILYQLLERSAYLEVTMRCFFESVKPVKNIALKIFNYDKHKNRNKPVIKGQWKSFTDCIRQIGIEKGDILLVHSSMQGMATMGVSAEKVIDFLISVVGDEGTLVFPVYPDYELMKKDRMIPYYDPELSKPWTGKLPRIFLSYPGVVRSLFPHNTLAAKGRHAQAMMKGNLKAKNSQGKYSAWDYCIRNHVKILYLGVEACTSCTVVHYAEDILDEKWPVRDWFGKETYQINCNGKIIEKDIFTRKEKWFQYYKMFSTGRWMRERGYLKEYDINGMYVGYMDRVPELSKKLIGMARNGKLLFKIPQKYWR